MGNYRKLWWTLIGVLGVTFCLLGWFGREVYREAPPIPAHRPRCAQGIAPRLIGVGGVTTVCASGGKR